MSFALAIAHSRVGRGVFAPPVVVEAHISNGLPAFAIVGLPEATIKESRERVRSALLNTHFSFPSGRITVNLAPADLPKEGGRFDLPIALAILAATGQIPKDRLHTFEFTGELALSGALRAIAGVLPFAIATAQAKRTLILPEQNAQEASLAKTLTILPATHLLAVCAHLSGEKPLTPYINSAPTASVKCNQHLDLSDIYGQAHAKRALEIAASGGHSLLLIGPPGTGKTMLANRFPGILPEMTESEALDTMAILSVAGKPFDAKKWQLRPFRAPHHSASCAALVGGGSPPKPGEISLAHNGVLFLDELPEFKRAVLEALREPLETGHITISRASHQAEFPAKFTLIAAMNPCPCGHLGNPRGNCRCTSDQILRYQARISGPLLDRLDMHIEVPALPKTVFAKSKQPTGEQSAVVRLRVGHAQQRQQKRQACPNAALLGDALATHCLLSPENAALLCSAMDRFGLSARAAHKILKLARTIADLADSNTIETLHLKEALGYRAMDRKQPL